MRKLLITTAVFLSIAAADSAQAGTLKSYCDTPKSINVKGISKALTTAEMLKTFETAQYGDKLSPDEKIACQFILLDTIQKGLVGSKDKVLQLIVNLTENPNKNAKYRYTYTGKITISDYKRAANGHKKKLRREQLRGKFEILPKFPPILPPIIIAPPPAPPPVTAP